MFAEPSVDVASLPKGVSVSTRACTVGAFGNWYLGLAELYQANPSAAAYLMVQDDAVFCRGVREYVETTLWPEEYPGVVSLYKSSAYRGVTGTGFQRIDPGWSAWGALAYVFRSDALRALLTDPLVINHRLHGPSDGQRNVDSVVGDWCRRAGLGYWVHSPSLVQHVGETSTLWPNAGANGRRRASDFPGEKFDALSLLTARPSTGGRFCVG